MLCGRKKKTKLTLGLGDEGGVLQRPLAHLLGRPSGQHLAEVRVDGHEVHLAATLLLLLCLPLRFLLLLVGERAARVAPLQQLGWGRSAERRGGVEDPLSHRHLRLDGSRVAGNGDDAKQRYNEREHASTRRRVLFLPN